MANAEQNRSDLIRLWDAACAAENYNKQAWMDVEGQLRKCGAIYPPAKRRRFNPFFCRTEGMRRMTIAISLVVLFFWTWFIAAVTNGFARESDVLGMVIVPIAAYLLVLAGRGLYRWVAFGFLIERVNS